MSERVFRLPDLGEGLTEAEIIEWQVSEGDTVEVDQHVVVVETAKATVEVPCPYAGTVHRVHGAVGETVEVGQPLVSVQGPESTGAATGSPAGDAAAAPPDRAGLAGADQYREEERAGSGAVLVGYGTAERPSRRRRSIRGRASTTATLASEHGNDGSGDHDEHGVERRSGGGDAAAGTAVRVISPLVRKLAHDHGVHLGELARQLDGAVIRRSDVEGALRDGAGPALAPAAEATAAAVSGEEEARIPLRGVRKAIADKLSTSRREIPDATTWVDVDATGLVEARDALRESRPDAGIGLLALLARITVAGLSRYPDLNASVDTERAEIVRHGRVHLGFAAQSPRGLVVPVVHDAHRLTTAELAAELRRLTAQAREGTLSPAELTGGTFTLNNYGVFGVDGSTPIINHPEAAMLGVGRIVDKPWAHEGQLALRKVSQLSFTFDHRVCDGGVAGGFLRQVADWVEHPTSLLADV